MSDQKVPCGLINQGMTCYLNAVLQTLFMTDEFRDRVLRLRNEVTGKSSEEHLLKALADLFRSLQHGRTAVSTGEVTKMLKVTNVFEQQDAAEYLQMILHRVPEPSEIFRGIKGASTVCSHCKYNNEELTDFVSIPLSINDRGTCDVEHALMEYLGTHDMSGEDQLYCVTCNKMRDMETKSYIKKCPEILALQLKRFEMVFSGNKLHYWKNESKVNIPSNLQAYACSPVYDLYAVINHHGSVSGGHYDAIIKDKRGNWYHFNDDRVTKCLDYQWIDNRSSSAYLLMYRKRYCGLEDRGSTSSLNAVLQTLFMTEEFRKHVKRRGGSSDGNFTEELKKLFGELETQERNAVSSAELMKSLGIADADKRDAAELLRLILVKTRGSSELFKGTMKTTRTCGSCRHKPEETFEDFLSLKVSLQNSQDVEHVLQAYARENKSAVLAHCGKRTVVETKSEMMKFPEHLMVELKRSETHSSFWPSSSKIEQEVILGPHIKVSSHMYELYAVVNYSKALSGAGRYNADIKCEDEIWRRFEDHNVLESLLNVVFRSEISTHRSSDARLLVYRRREQTAGDTGGGHRVEDQRLMPASKMTQPNPAGKIQKTQTPREDHSQSPSMSTNTDSKGKRSRYCGLEDRGSTSSLNAVLQTLFMTEEFRKHVKRRGGSSDGNFTEELKKLFGELETQERNAVSSAELMKSLGIADADKRDAAELLRLILVKTRGSSELFKGTMKTTRTCGSCRHKPEETFEDFLSLEVSLQNSQDVKDPVQACIDQMCKEHQQYGAHCGKMTVVETKSEMKFPEHLMVELKRSETHSSNGSSSSKNEQEVIFRPHIKVSSHMYELYAVVNYSKALSGAGRYNADIKCEDEIWRRFEDHKVSQSSFRSEISTHRSSDARLLVYRRREQTAGDTGGGHSLRSRDLPSTEEKKSSSLRKSEQQSQIQTGAPRQALEDPKTRIRYQSSLQADGERLITQVLEAADGVTREEAIAALNQNLGNPTAAVQQLKIEQLCSMTGHPPEQCRKTLEKFSWDLQRVLRALTAQNGQRPAL